MQCRQCQDNPAEARFCMACGQAVGGAPVKPAEAPASPGSLRASSPAPRTAPAPVSAEHNRIVREQTEAHRGREVELRGDGFLLAFASARHAARCAVALQQSFSARNASNAGHPIRIRIGIHTGEVIQDADKFFGRTVIQAFRIADLAAGEEILTSAATAQLLRSGGDLRFGAEREVVLDGFEGRHQVFALDWR